MGGSRVGSAASEPSHWNGCISGGRRQTDLRHRHGQERIRFEHRSTRASGSWLGAAHGACISRFEYGRWLGPVGNCRRDPHCTAPHSATCVEQLPDQPLPCAPMITGHNCFGAVLYPITMADFVIADVTDSMLDGVIAGFPNTYGAKVGKTSDAMYK